MKELTSKVPSMPFQVCFAVLNMYTKLCMVCRTTLKWLEFKLYKGFTDSGDLTGVSNRVFKET